MRTSTIMAASALLLGGLLAICEPLLLNAQDKAPAAKAPDVPKVSADAVLPVKRTEIQRIIGILERPMVLERTLELSFVDMLAWFEEKYDLTIVLDPKWTRGVAANAEDPGKVAFRANAGPNVTLGKLKNVRVETALNLVLEQVDAGFLIGSDHIRIVSMQNWSAQTQQFRLIREIYGNNDAPVTDDRLVRTIPIVNASWTATPLSEVLKDLEARTGTTLSVTATDFDPSKILITQTIANVPLDYAIAVLARRTENLRAVRVGNAIVLDTPARIADLVKANEARNNPNDNRLAELQGAIDGLQGKVGELEKEIVELKKK